MSHTVGPEGHTPSILSFEVQALLPIGPSDQTPQTEIKRMNLMSMTPREHETILSKHIISRAIQVAAPNEACI